MAMHWFITAQLERGSSLLACGEFVVRGKMELRTVDTPVEEGQTLFRDRQRRRGYD